MIPNHVFATYFYPDTFPVEATELLGSEPEKAWKDAAEMGPGKIPVLIGATTDGQWLAGLLMFLETLEMADGKPGAEHVASIRLLVVGRQYQNAGLAGFLIRRALKTAVAQRCARVRTTAGFGCTDHMIMYERLGFTKVPFTERPYMMEVRMGSGV